MAHLTPEREAEIAAKHPKFAGFRRPARTPAIRPKIRFIRSLTPQAREIVQTVANARGFTLAQMLHPSRGSVSIAQARAEAMWTLYQVQRPNGRHAYSSTVIGQMFGGRDHTTVLHAVRVHGKRVGA